MKPPLLHAVALPFGTSTSNVAFGCASLLRLPSARARARLIHCALGLGIRHFDVARMYGLGAAEGDLGRALAHRPEAVTVATKFGIPSAAPSRVGLAVQSAGRWLLRQVPALRKRAKAGLGRAARDFSPAQLQHSFETSLRELRREKADLLFLHEPGPEDGVPPATWEALERLRSQGAVGSYGFSGAFHERSPWAKQAPATLACQADLAGDQRRLLAGGTLPWRITGMFGLVRGVATEARAWLERDPAACAEWSQRLNGDLRQQDDLIHSLVAAALARNTERLVVIATTDERRLERLWRFLAQPPAELAAYAEFAERL